MSLSKNLLSPVLLIILGFVCTGRANHEGVAGENKKLALAFFQEFFGDKNIQSVDKYIGDRYIQHISELADGKEALKKWAEVWFKDNMKKETVDIRRAAADGDLVWLHQKANVKGKDMAIVSIMRFDQGMIVEHWEVMEEVLAKSANQNTVF